MWNKSDVLEGGLSTMSGAQTGGGWCRVLLSETLSRIVPRRPTCSLSVLRTPCTSPSRPLLTCFATSCKLLRPALSTWNQLPRPKPLKFPPSDPSR
eukprot:2330970-Rhodomonas_salina.4